MLQVEVFLATFLAMLKKEINCKLQQTCDMKPKSEFDKIKKNKILNCWICGFPLNCRDRMDERCLALEKIDSNGIVIGEHFLRTLYKASKISGLSLCSLRNAIEKGNRLLVR